MTPIKREAEKKRTVVFALTTGGMGDFVNYMVAIKWVADNFPSVEGFILAPDYFVDLARNMIRENEGWTVASSVEQHLIPQGTSIKAPMPSPVNPTVCHLLDLGFMYFAESSPPPWDAVYPTLDLERVKLHGAVKGKRYAVMTPGGTAKNRTMIPKTFNKIKDYIIACDIKPVFLGSDKLRLKGTEKKYVDFNEGYDFTGGLNLINKTSLLEAAKIISESEFIVGIDNGLLHLAACTEANIVFGYTIAGPQQRRPVRHINGSATIDVVVSEEELSCIHCQEKLKFDSKHDFKTCFYKDMKCLDLLDFSKFKAGIDWVLEFYPRT